MSDFQGSSSAPTKTLVDSKTSWHRFDRGSAWDNSGEVLLLDNHLVQGSAWYVGYLIVHEPSSAVYFGTTTDIAKTYRKWFARLKGVDAGAKNLSVAFRAVFTKREDFLFKMVAFFNNAEAAAEWKRTRPDQVIAQLGRNKCLNVDDRSAETKGFWKRQVPAEDWAWRFGSMDKGWYGKAVKTRSKIRSEHERAADAKQEAAEGRDYLHSIFPNMGQGIPGQGPVEVDHGVSTPEPANDVPAVDVPLPDNDDAADAEYDEFLAKQEQQEEP